MLGEQRKGRDATQRRRPGRGVERATRACDALFRDARSDAAFTAVQPSRNDRSMMRDGGDAAAGKEEKAKTTTTAPCARKAPHIGAHPRRSAASGGRAPAWQRSVGRVWGGAFAEPAEPCSAPSGSSASGYLSSTAEATSPPPLPSAAPGARGQAARAWSRALFRSGSLADGAPPCGAAACNDRGGGGGGRGGGGGGGGGSARGGGGGGAGRAARRAAALAYGGASGTAAELMARHRRRRGGDC